MKLIYIRIPTRPSLSCSLFCPREEYPCFAELQYDALTRPLLFREEPDGYHSEKFLLFGKYHITLQHESAQAHVSWGHGMIRPEVEGDLSVELQELFN